MTRVVPLVAVAAALIASAQGAAAWSASAGGSGAAKARTMPGAAAPSASLAGLGSVSVSWTASTFADGASVSGYVVKRYDALLGTPQTVGAACAGIVTATSCTETGVPTGTWKYTVTPAQGLWRGTESAQSGAVVVI